MPFLTGTGLIVPEALADTARVEPGEPIVLQLKWAHQFQFAGYYAALDKGFYAEEGLDVRIAPARPGQDAIDSVLAGEATYGIGSSDLVLARGQGHPVVALAAIYQHSPLVLLASRASGIESVHDLVGKRVMIEEQSAAILAYLRDERVPLDDLDIRHHRFSPTALIDGEVDAISAYTTDEAFILEQAGVDYRVLSPRASGIDFYGDTLFTIAAEVDGHPLRVDRFVRASLRGWRYAVDNPVEIVDLIWTRYSQRHSRAHLMFEAQHAQPLIAADIVELGYMNPGRWRYIAEVYASLGLMPGDVDLDGFIWRPAADSSQSFSWLYVLLGAIALTCLAIAFAALRFYRTSRRLSQEIVKREIAQEEAAQASARYRQLIEAAPFPVVISELAAGTIRFVNPLAAKKLAIDRRRLNDTSVRAFYAHPNDRLRLLEALDKDGRVEGIEIKARAANGNEFWTSVSSAVIDFDGVRSIFSTFADISEHKSTEQRLREMTDNDPLGVTNRRRFMELLTAELRRSVQHHQPLTLIALDLDDFKHINDTHGHPFGDDVLRMVIDLISKRLRHRDTLGRTGGDRFCFFLPDTSLEFGLAVAENIRGEIEALRMTHGDAALHVTASIGITESGRMDDVQRLIVRAESAVQAAKREGRNRVIVGTSGIHPSA